MANECVIKNASQGTGIIVEQLFPEIANLYGDTGNVRYLKKCLPAALFVEDELNAKPHFADTIPNLIYMGPMSEHAQELVIERLMPYKNRILELIDKGVIFLLTGNAAEVFWKSIECEDGTSIKGLGLFDLIAKRKMFNRYNRHCMGKMGELTIVGYKNQFTHTYGDNSAGYFFDVEKGDGINRSSKKEGVRRNNFIATYLLGPILIQNPHFTKYLLEIMCIKDAELAFEDTVIKAYERRLEEYKDFDFPII